MSYIDSVQVSHVGHYQPYQHRINLPFIILVIEFRGHLSFIYIIHSIFFL